MKKTTIAYGMLTLATCLVTGCTTTNQNPDQTVHGSIILKPTEIAAAIASAPKFDPFGFSAHNLSTLDEEHTDWARMELEIGERLKVISIDQGSLASQAGLMRGDVIVSINGSNIKRGQEGVDDLKNEITPKIDWSLPIRVLIIRDGGAIELEFPVSEKANTLALNIL